MANKFDEFFKLKISLKTNQLESELRKIPKFLLKKNFEKERFSIFEKVNKI